MRNIIKQWPILSLLPMCTNDAGLSIELLMSCKMLSDKLWVPWVFSMLIDRIYTFTLMTLASQGTFILI